MFAATLSTKGAAGMRSAARLWGLWPDTEAVEVVVPRGVMATLTGATVHWTSNLPETTVRHGIPLTTPPYTLVRLGAVASRADLEDVVSRALSSRLVSVRALEAALERISGPGVRGTRVLKSILREWGLGVRPPDSVLETRMLTLLHRFKLPQVEFQHVVRSQGRFLARVDFAYPALRLAIEVDGHAHHSRAADRERDARRRNRLSLAGWTVLVFTWAQVQREGHDVAAAIAAQIQTCSAQPVYTDQPLQDRVR